MPADAVTQPLPAAAPVAAETGVPVAITPDVAASALGLTVPGSGATTGIVVFKARGTSWVEVVDANGVVQVRKTMTDGTVVGASGVMPLAVVVGRADAIEVQVRGLAFDLTSVAKDNVARFEVK
jgi:cytoskeleton protein RodZ